jgi:hypothetical protein
VFLKKKTKCMKEKKQESTPGNNAGRELWLHVSENTDDAGTGDPTPEERESMEDDESEEEQKETA